MAKNLPNIGKPVPEMSDPANIKVVSDAIEATAAALGLPVTDLTTTAKSIVPAINELEANNSLLTMPVAKSATYQEIDSFLDSYSSSFANGTYYRVHVSFTSAHPVLIGGGYYIEGFKTSSDYEWQRATSYNGAAGATGTRNFSRTKAMGTWRSWVTIGLLEASASGAGNGSNSAFIVGVPIPPAASDIGWTYEFEAHVDLYLYRAVRSSGVIAFSFRHRAAEAVPTTSTASVTVWFQPA